MNAENGMKRILNGGCLKSHPEAEIPYFLKSWLYYNMIQKHF